MMYPFVAQNPEGMRAEIMEYPLAATQTVRPGALIRLAAGVASVIETADPTPILGFAESTNEAGTVIYEDTVLVAIAKANTYFAFRANATLTLAHVGNVYGLVLTGDEWEIDISDTTATRVQIMEVFLDRQIAVAAVMEDHRQIPITPFDAVV